MSGDSSNRSMLAKLGLLTAGMFAFGYLIAPLYDKLCATRAKQTSPAGVARSSQVDSKRTLAIQYDANVRGSLAWNFRPLQKSSKVHPGEVVQVQYEVTNQSDRVVVGQAVPSYAPAAAGVHFHKLECFCFRRQMLRPHETRSMPIVFVIDDAMPADLSTITLSYTFFEVDQG
jgi:cytochrome c oxidase assembly protein subunit 11